MVFPRSSVLSGVLIVPVCLMLLSGCSSKREDKWTRSRPPVFPVSGQIIYNDEPVAEAIVTFQPVDETGRGGSAITDSQGYFEAQTFDPGDGLTEGEHRVAIRKVQLVDASGKVVTEVGEPGGLREKHLVPKQYSDFEKSRLEITVSAEGENQLGEIKLED